jgi:hypothetical protein
MRCAMAAFVWALAMPAIAAPQADIGTLTCTLAEHGEKDSNPDSQSKAMHCAFKPVGAGPEEIYIGEIKKVGSQSELSGRRVLIWSVVGPNDTKLGPGVLEQTYVGEVAPDAADKSKPSKLLVGERDKTFGLQPISDDSLEPNAARSVTVVELRIKSTPT